MTTKTLERPAPMTGLPSTFAANADVRALLILGEIEAAGTLTGLDAANAVASTARLLGITPPGYALLHDLAEDGFLEASTGAPRFYRLTSSGHREAERLAQVCWPRLSQELDRLNRRFAPAAPRAWPESSFATEWTDGACG
jgi:DNA-binding PadR family transcriptional regulator